MKSLIDLLVEKLKVSANPNNINEYETTVGDFLAWRFGVKDIIYLEKREVKPESLFLNTDGFDDAYELIDYLWKNRRKPVIMKETVEQEDGYAIVFYECVLGAFTIKFEGMIFEDEDMDGLFSLSKFVNESNIYEKLKVSSNTDNILTVDEFIKKCKYISNIQGDPDNYYVEIPQLDEYKEFHHPNYDILPLINVTEDICVGNQPPNTLGKAYLTTVSLSFTYSGTPKFRLTYILSSYKQTKHYRMYTIILKNNGSLPEIIGEDLYEKLCIFLEEQLYKLYEE